MKKLWLGFAVCVFAVLCTVTTFAAGITMCILPEDFEGSLGTFSVVGESAEIGPFLGITLRGRTDRQYANTIPAQIGIDINEPGEYTVYVHTRDFNTNTGERHFRVGINKSSLDSKKLGAHGVHGWAWENAGSIKLEKGACVLKVYDTSGFYARCDMIIISSDKNLVLPETHNAMQEIASKHGVVKSDAELEMFLKPNQVFREGYFYTAANVEAFHDVGTWIYERNTWLKNDTPLRDRILKGLSGANPPEAKNAKITFSVPDDNEYYLWVRTKDFLENQGTRLFNTVIDGTLYEQPLGGHGVDGWAWERVKTGLLKKGYHVLEFADTFKNYARFDMFMVTDDKEFVPENSQVAAYKLLHRAKFQPDMVVPDMECPVITEPIGKSTVTYPVRPATEYAVSVNGTYIECKADFSGKYPMISAKSVFLALGGKVAYETEDSICVSKGDNAYLFRIDNAFCLNGKKKIELRIAPKALENEILIPVSFLEKLNGVKVQINGKDIEITHRIWK